MYSNEYLFLIWRQNSLQDNLFLKIFWKQRWLGIKENFTIMITRRKAVWNNTRQNNVMQSCYTWMKSVTADTKVWTWISRQWKM